jgi:hypothetical protein
MMLSCKKNERNPNGKVMEIYALDVIKIKCMIELFCFTNI